MQKLGFYMMQLIYVVVHVLFKECNETNKEKEELVVLYEMPFNIVK